MVQQEIFVSSIRSSIKHRLPLPVRKMFRACLHYSQRNLRWPIVLWQVRGERWSDKFTLLLSACAAPILTLRDLQKWQDPILLRDAMVHVPGIGNFFVRARTDDLWHVLPWREKAIADAMRSSLCEGDVFIDAGANIGIYTVLASRLVGPVGRVISVEMMPDTADQLESHVRLNGLQNVTLIRKALSDIPGQLVHATVQTGKHGQATIAQDVKRFGLGHVVEVETTTLDAILDGVGSVRMMKIDVEGAELKALQGASLLLQRLHAVAYESLGWRRCLDDPVDQLLDHAGFVLRRLDGNNWLAERTLGA